MTDKFYVHANTDESGRLHLSVGGELDRYTGATLVDTFEVWARRASEAEVDLVACTFMDLRGLRALADARRCLRAPARIHLVNVGSGVARILELSTLDDEFTVSERSHAGR